MPQSALSVSIDAADSQPSSTGGYNNTRGRGSRVALYVAVLTERGFYMRRALYLSQLLLLFLACFSCFAYAMQRKKPVATPVQPQSAVRRPAHSLLQKS